MGMNGMAERCTDAMGSMMGGGLMLLLLFVLLLVWLVSERWERCSSGALGG